jgi:hypothetical protein
MCQFFFEKSRCCYALKSLITSYAKYWNNNYNINRYLKFYYDETTICTRYTNIIFSYSFVGITNGVYWGVAQFDNWTNTYKYIQPLQEIVSVCETIPSNFPSIGNTQYYKLYIDYC